MDRFELTRQLFGAEITALVLRFETELHISIYGGVRPHIGAVTAASQGEAVSTTQFPGHKESVITEQWTDALLCHGFSPVVVEAGIHYDSLDRDGIQAVLACTDELLAACLSILGGSLNKNVNSSPGGAPGFTAG